MGRAIILLWGIFISEWIKVDASNKITWITKRSHLAQITSAVSQYSFTETVSSLSLTDWLGLALVPTKAISNELTPLLSLIQGVWRLSEAWLSIHTSYTSPSGLWFQETSLTLLSLSLLHSFQECFSRDLRAGS